MPTNFPATDDVFTEPSAPGSTPLGDPGDSTRDNTDNHEDLGDSIEAMQAEATYLAHTHDGTTRNGPKLTQANTHQSPDTDSGSSALHHTIGTGANQGAAGNHTHSVVNVWPVGAVFITEIAGNPNSVHGLPGTWTQIQGFFIVAAGSTFTGGTTGGTSQHTHSATFSTTGSHTHTSPTTDSSGDHDHTGSSTGSSTFGHDHGTSGSGSSALSVRYPSGTGSTSMNSGSHTHSTATASASGSGTSHTHTAGGTYSSGSHTHTLGSISSEGSHTHTSTISTSSHIPPYLSVYVWERTA